MRPTGPAFLHYLDSALAAVNSNELLQAVSDCFESVYTSLVGREHDKTVADINEAFLACHSNIRRRRLLEFCISPVFDKVPLPPELDEHASGPHNEANEFLWLFAIPFVVTFSPDSLARPIMLDDKIVDADAILSELETTGFINERGLLRSSSRLFKREDLQVVGPQRLAALFRDAELTQRDTLEPPLPLMFDPDMESYRSVTLFLVAAARMPVGQTHLFDTSRDWPAGTMARVIHASLASHGLGIDRVESLPPKSMAEMLFRFMGPAAAELKTNLANAKAEYVGKHGPMDVVVRCEMEGYAEINGRLANGTEFIIIPAFSFFETTADLDAFVGKACKDLGLPYQGVTRPRIDRPMALH